MVKKSFIYKHCSKSRFPFREALYVKMAPECSTELPEYSTGAKELSTEQVFYLTGFILQATGIPKGSTARTKTATDFRLCLTGYKNSIKGRRKNPLRPFGFEIIEVAVVTKRIAV